MKHLHSRHHWILAAVIALVALLTLTEAGGHGVRLNPLVCDSIASGL